MVPIRAHGAYAVLSLMGALGVAANELFMYPYWILEKGYAEKLGDRNDPQWASRARFWTNVIRLDAGLATLIATVVTAAFFLLGAAVLFRQGVKPTGFAVVEQIASVYTATYGEWSRWMFYLGAFCTLFSTLVVYTAASGRMWTDLFTSLGLVDGKNRTRRQPLAPNLAARLARRPVGRFFAVAQGARPLDRHGALCPWCLHDAAPDVCGPLDGLPYRSPCANGPRLGGGARGQHR